MHSNNHTGNSSVGSYDVRNSTHNSSIPELDNTFDSSLSIIDVANLTASTVNNTIHRQNTHHMKLKTETSPHYHSASDRQHRRVIENITTDDRTLEARRTSVAGSFNDGFPPASPKQPIESLNQSALSVRDGPFLTDDLAIQQLLDHDDEIQTQQNAMAKGQLSQHDFSDSVSGAFSGFNETIDSFCNQQTFDEKAVSECRYLAHEQQKNLADLERYLSRGSKDIKNISLGMTDDETITSRINATAQDYSFEVMEDTTMPEGSLCGHGTIPNPVLQKTERSMMNQKFEPFETQADIQDVPCRGLQLNPGYNQPNQRPVKTEAGEPIAKKPTKPPLGSLQNHRVNSYKDAQQLFEQQKNRVMPPPMEVIQPQQVQTNQVPTENPTVRREQPTFSKYFQQQPCDLSRSQISRTASAQSNTSAEISHLANNLTKLSISKCANIASVAKFHGNLRRSLDPMMANGREEAPSPVLAREESYDESVGHSVSSPDNHISVHEKTTALRSHADDSLAMTFCDASDTLPMDYSFADNSGVQPAALEIHGAIESLKFITSTPVGTTASASIGFRNTFSNDLNLHLTFYENSTASGYDPLFPFKVKDNQAKIMLDPMEAGHTIVEFTPNAPGVFSTTFEIHELETGKFHKIKIIAKAGTAHLEMDMSTLQLKKKPPGFLEPVEHSKNGDALNTTTVIDPVTYLGELDFTLKFDLNVSLKNLGTCTIRNAKLSLRHEDGSKFIALEGNNCIENLEPGDAHDLRLKVRFQRNSNGKYSCQPGYRSVSLVALWHHGRGTQAECLLCHKFTAKVGQTKVKIPKEMHKLTFYKNDVKVITGIRNCGDVTVSLLVRPNDERDWRVDPKELLLEPNAVGSVQVAYRGSGTQSGRDIVEYTTKLRFIAQPNGYSAMVTLEAIPEIFDRCSSPVKEEVSSKKRYSKLARKRSNPSASSSSATGLKMMEPQLFGNKQWLIYEPSIVGGYVKLSVTVQNPTTEPMDLTITIEGDALENFELKLPRSLVSSTTPTSPRKPIVTVLPGRDILLPVYYRPRTNGMHLANLTIRSPAFKEQKKFMVPLVAWTTDSNSRSVVYGEKNAVLMNKDSQNNQTIVSIFKIEGESDMFDFEIHELKPRAMLALTNKMPRFIISLNTKLKDLTMLTVRPGFPEAHSKAERSLNKKLPPPFSQFLNANGLGDDFLRQVFQTLYHSEIDRELSKKDQDVQKMLKFTSIKPPSDYIYEKSIHSVNMVYRQDHSMAMQSCMDAENVPIGTQRQQKPQPTERREPLRETNARPTPGSNQAYRGPLAHKNPSLRLSHPTSTPNRRLPKQNSFPALNQNDKFVT